MKKRSAVITAILSILIPGLGHIYHGRLVFGIILTVCFLLFDLFILTTGVLLTFSGLVTSLVIYLLSYIAVIIHSILIALKKSEYQPQSFRKWIIYILFVISFYALSYLIGHTSIVEANRLASNSMNPTLQEGDFIISMLDTPDLTQGDRGQLLIFSSPFDNDVTWIKRAIAFEGETIEIRSDSIFINGDYYKDEFSIVSEPANKSLSPHRIPEGKVFVLGDNRNNSEDSRHFGSIDVKKIVGRPLYIYWSHDKSRIGTTL